MLFGKVFLIEKICRKKTAAEKLQQKNHGVRITTAKP
jgi:hypothetical protein